MATLHARELRTVWRRRLFTFAVATFIVLALLLAVGSPLMAEYVQPGLIGPVVFAVEWVVIATGLTWLALFALSKRRRDRPGTE
ncbi:MAG: hypothetical protein CMH94_03975 [Oceanicaulis sp.]|uniref:Uncharacterized protein n=1 Tax=Maricaulis virginensis TaxID=144022 RepID=A0A9W6IIL1_9PROT|nr:hypothetical protein [Maricaulis virginensis]MAC38846.1 hypothetical protein [Oceanicaulis sp.]MAZ90837.1 hypothetical protein [Maricaulis sp.]MBI74739.1 hypothetical protein [Oceanicaulis sp.]GLK51002.1 hypothetical protein GCM10017621_05100 [Maricaulis virginensis]|tara:strand:+ start:1827 stop:2078 length:252 start_codon:yes stop_codon:yes gene_type:complete